MDGKSFLTSLKEKVKNVEKIADWNMLKLNVPAPGIMARQSI